MRITAGAVADGIDIVCQPLPIDMRQVVDWVVWVASQEVSPKTSAAAVAAEVEYDLESPAP